MSKLDYVTNAEIEDVLSRVSYVFITRFQSQEVEDAVNALRKRLRKLSPCAMCGQIPETPTICGCCVRCWNGDKS